jgi:Ca2+:H+ antiporter
VARRILWALLALTPVVLIARYVLHLDETTLFVLAGLALVPLAWLIGEATEQAAEYTGPGVGGFLNASFGNAPELIIALLAVANGLPDVVRGSLTGSVVSNMLLVLGAAMLAGGDGEVDVRSLRWQLITVLAAVLLLVIPSAFAWGGRSPDSHGLFLLSIPISFVLLAAYLVVTVRNLRIHRAAESGGQAGAEAWRFPTAIGVLAVATVATAFVSEVLVHSLNHFGETVGLDQFFISVVIVAIVGNAAEHGGAVVIARRGNTTLATEIAVTSAMQVAVFVIPVVCLLSWLVGPGLPLAFRVIEIVTMAGAAVVAAVLIWDGRSRRRDGALLVGAYGVAVVAYYLS